MQESSYLILVLLLSVWGALQIKRSNIQTWYRNFHISPGVFAPWVWCYNWVKFEDFWPWEMGWVYFVCEEEWSKYWEPVGQHRLPLLVFWAQLDLVLLIFIRQNFLVPLCFSEVTWLPGQRDVRGNNTGHFQVTAFNFWCKTFQTSASPPWWFRKQASRWGLKWSGQSPLPISAGYLAWVRIILLFC